MAEWQARRFAELRRRKRDRPAPLHDRLPAEPIDDPEAARAAIAEARAER